MICAYGFFPVFDLFYLSSYMFFVTLYAIHLFTLQQLPDYCFCGFALLPDFNVFSFLVQITLLCTAVFNLFFNSSSSKQSVLLSLFKGRLSVFYFYPPSLWLIYHFINYHFIYAGIFLLFYFFFITIVFLLILIYMCLFFLSKVLS